jgi:outer membrane protein assembly factor BamB
MSASVRLLIAACLLAGACAKDPVRGGSGTAGAAAGGGRGGVASGAAGTGGAVGAGGSSAGAGGGTAGTTSAGRGGAAPPISTGVLQHHNHASRDGLYVEPALTEAAIHTLRLDPTFAPTYAGPVWAQPLYLDGTAGGRDLIFVATRLNHVIAFDAMTGQQVWDRGLGTQAVRPTSVCAPGPAGISGTPIIDGATRTLYVDALTGGDVNKHLVFALDADTGAVRPGWPVDVDATARFGTLAFDSRVQHQHAALALLDGTLFVPYGGFPGDCGAYRGWVVAISTTAPTRVTAWATRAEGGGVWAPAGIASDGTSLFFATGNTRNPPTWSDGEAVFKLAPSLAPAASSTDFFVPASWMALDAGDLDLGGTAPVPFDLPGASPSRLLVLFGKDANAYLLDRDNLGGMAPPLIVDPLLWRVVISAHAVFTTPSGAFVVTKGPGYRCESGILSGNMLAIKVSATTPPALSVPWCGLYVAPLSVPIVSATDHDGTDATVWVIGIDGSLHALDAKTGSYYFGTAGMAAGITDLERYQAPIIRNGRLYVAGNTRLYAFTVN